MYFNKHSNFFEDKIILRNLVNIIKSETSLAAAVFDSNKNILVSSIGWSAEFENKDIKESVNNLLGFCSNIIDSHLTKQKIETDDKSIACFPVKIAGDTFGYAVFLIKENPLSNRMIIDAYHEIFENFEEGYFELDTHGNLVYGNKKIREITGMSKEEILGLNYRDYTSLSTSSRLFSVFRNIYKTGKPSIVPDLEIKRKDGSTAFFEVSSGLLKDERDNLLGFRGICRDISEKVRAENEKRTLLEQLQQAQRFEAIATLAGGIANDFNNLLMSIQGNVSLLQLAVGSNSKAAEYISRIEEQIKKGASLTRQLLGFSVAETSISFLGLIDINSLVERTCSHFSINREDIKIETCLTPEAYCINGDTVQIEHVLLNLYLNSWHSMPNGGILTVTTVKVFCADDFVAPFGVVSGDFIKIIVADTGVGMDETIQRKIFNPFFTTRETGKGSGLGLASAFGIVKNHGGFITVKSEPGAGSAVNVYLPVSQTA